MASAKNITSIALISALICIISPFSVPLGVIPVSLSSFIVMLAFSVFGTRKSLIAVLIYILIGIIGVPVFSGFGSGIGKILGPTGGFIIGYPLMILVMGLFERLFTDVKACLIICLVAGTLMLYLAGVIWMSTIAGIELKAAFISGVLPFILPDVVKIIFVRIISPQLKKRCLQ